MSTKRQRVKPGDVLAIAMPSLGKVAYARVYGEGTIAVYSELKDPGQPPPLGHRVFLFQVGVYAQVLGSGAWPRVARDPFAHGEDSAPRPCFVMDRLDGGFSIYHQGSMRPASRDEVQGLEPAAAWDKQHVEDRIEAAYLGRAQPWVDAPWEVGMLNLQGAGGH